MKNKILIALVVLVSFGLTSCDKEDASKDVTSLVNKMNYYCDKYDEFNADGVISTEKAEGSKEESEYDQLKKIAQEYYEGMNKINKLIKEEQEKAAEGKKIDGYEEAYKLAVEEQKAEIEEAAAKFEETLKKIEK